MGIPPCRRSTLAGAAGTAETCASCAVASGAPDGFCGLAPPPPFRTRLTVSTQPLRSTRASRKICGTGASAVSVWGSKALRVAPWPAMGGDLPLVAVSGACAGPRVLSPNQCATDVPVPHIVPTTRLLGHPGHRLATEAAMIPRFPHHDAAPAPAAWWTPASRPSWHPGAATARPRLHGSTLVAAGQVACRSPRCPPGLATAVPTARPRPRRRPVPWAPASRRHLLSPSRVFQGGARRVANALVGDAVAPRAGRAPTRRSTVRGCGSTRAPRTPLPHATAMPSTRLPV